MDTVTLLEILENLKKDETWGASQEERNAIVEQMKINLLTL